MGTFINRPGSDACFDCPAGKISNEDRSLCSDCAAGEFTFNSSRCVSCPKGTYAPQPLTDACIHCGPGLKTDNTTRGTTCTPCDAGSYSKGLESSCTKCSVGQAAPSGQSSCSNCSTGTFAATSGSASCTNCPAGSIAGETGAVGCTECSPGQYQGRPGASVCERCDAGKLATEPGQLGCKDCATGYDSDEGSRICDLAAAGYYFRFGNMSTSIICPSDAKCLGRFDMPRPREGYWVERRNIKYADDVYSCFRGTCIGGAVPKQEDHQNAANNATSGNSPRRVLSGEEAGGGPDPAAACWQRTAYKGEEELLLKQVCDPDQLLCLTGSDGPLCGSCQNT